MSHSPLHDHKTDPGFLAPWEKAFDRVLSPFEEFIHRQTTTGLILMLSAVVAVFVANSSLANAYHHLTHTPLGLQAGSWSLSMSLHHFVNDGLMALFFFVVGLELKREMLVGELARPRQAALPIVAALGGMVAPAMIYLAFNPAGTAAAGWGIPMATDIAFAIGALVLLASRVPRTLITFLVALAIVDDLGAVVVIALFYTDQIVMPALLAAGGLTLLLVVFNRAGIRMLTPYFLVALLLWYALLQSGVHATLAGVIAAFTIPAYPQYDPEHFSTRIGSLLEAFGHSRQRDGNIMTNDEMRLIAQQVEHHAQKLGTPLQRLEQFWHLPVAFLVIPAFALVNAGIPFAFDTLSSTLSHPVTLGVMLGLVGGKCLGITGASWLALKFGLGELPAGTRFSQISAVSLMGGIGFTMAIFIAELGFAGEPELLLMAKTGILLASLFAGLAGFIALWWLGRHHDE